MSKRSIEYLELQSLLTLLCDELITDGQRRRLFAILEADPAARRFYIEYLDLDASLRWHCAEPGDQPPDLGEPLDKLQGKAEDKTFGSSVAGFLGRCYDGGLSFLSKSSVFSILVAIGVPIAMFLLVLTMVHDVPPGPVATRVSPPASSSVSPVLSARVAAATVGRVHECIWDDDSTPATVGAALMPGRRIRLSQGLVELRFADGADVLVQGPSVFEIENRSRGFLHAGRLVARVPKGAEGFTIATTAANVVDFGTEFGVAVDKDRVAAEVHVFEGEVALETRSDESSSNLVSQNLTAGNAARVEATGTKGRVVVREIPSSDDHFVRSLSDASSDEESAGPAIVADFSGGSGDSSVDQYPGVAGEGWAGGWRYREAEGMKIAVSVERTKPLRDGGDYLTVLAKRKSGTAAVRRTLERRLELTDRVDLTKPHVVSFDFRIDDLGGFTMAGDHLIICNNMVSEAEPHPRPMSGWHIRIEGADRKRTKAGHWTFSSGHGRQKERRVDSGIPAVEGTVYSFRVLADPDARRWTPSISVDGGPWSTFEPMKVRSAGTAAENGYWPYLYLWWSMEGGNKKGERERIKFSIDSIRIIPAE